MAVGEPQWPVVVFESDGFPLLVASPEEVQDLYEPEYWDEFESAFDSLYRPVAVTMVEGRRVFVVEEGAGDQEFVVAARAALTKAWRIGRFSVHRAPDSEVSRIESMDSAQLWTAVRARA